MRLSPLGDSAIVLALGETVNDAAVERARALAFEIERRRPHGVIDVVPAFASVTVFYDIARTNGYATLCTELENILGRSEVDALHSEPRLIEIPVCYGGQFGPDLEAVAAHAAATCDEVVALHSGAEYRVNAIGFVPGFAYLAGLPEKINTPRRPKPRASVPPGSVGIGGNQTGVYPYATPGGWNLIGRTPQRLFDANRDEPALLRAGDRVRFCQIAAEEFDSGSLPATGESPLGSKSKPAGAAERISDAAMAVLKAGMQTTIQDMGRSGHRASGVPVCGVSDSFAARAANLLVGNPDDAAVLEFALVGPELRFEREALIALGGGQFEGLAGWRPVRVSPGTVLRLGAAKRGCRGFLAVAGGIDVPPVLGSRSTYLHAAFGGLDGRALRDGDVLHVAVFARAIRDHWHIDERILPAYSAEPVVRVVPGEQAGEFDRKLFGTEYRMTAQSDRMGLRLSGPPLSRNNSTSLLSAAVVPGTIQIPADGQPIILMADAQTIGGYPQVAHVISVDLPLVAQLRPGDTVRFREVTLQEAHKLVLAREHALAILRAGIAEKFL